MNWLLLSRLLGLLGMLIGGSMIFSIPWSFPLLGETDHTETRAVLGMTAAMACSIVVGLVLYLIGRRDRSTILRKEALAFVGLGWMLAGLLGALPYLFTGTQRAPGIPLTVADAVFESVSGFTTTGASVLTELEAAPNGRYIVPRCVLFWRSFTHWLGGMGIVVLFVAILGQLGAGGKALMRREVPGPINETVRPRVQETATLMWVIYVSLSVLMTGVLIVEGMSLYDALCHTFGTLATGGFSTRNASIGAFDSGLIEGTVIVFMVMAGTNFALYYVLVHRRGTGAARSVRGRLKLMFSDPEFRVYLCILAVIMLILTGNLLWNRTYATLLEAMRHSTFTTVSIMTTTGYGTEDFTAWSQFSKGLLLLLMFVGGCSGSTGGGIKVIRMILFLKIIRLEIETAFRPNLVRPLRVGRNAVDPALRHEVVVYFSLILMIFVTGWMALAAIEPDTQWTRTGHSADEKLIDCASAVAATLNNIGPGLGVLGPHSSYTDFSAQGKLLLSLLMLLGRLELFAILAIFLPAFWRHQ